ARYGNHNISVNSSRVRPHARLLSSDSAEIQSERAQLIQKIDACRDQLQNNERRVRDLSNREQSILAEKARAIDPERERLRKEKEAIRRLAQQYQAHTLKVEGVRKRLQLLQQSERQDGDSQQAKQRIRDKMRDNAAVRAELVCRVAELLKTRVRLVADKSAVVALNVAGTKLRLTELEEQASVYRSRLAEAQHDLDEAKRQAEEDKVSASRLLREAQRVTETISDEERAMMQESMDPSTNIEDLEARLEAAQQRLELISVSGLSARVIEEYNRRTQELKDKQRRIKEMQRAWHKLVADKVRTRQQWEDPLEELVAKINVAFTESFEAMGCKGEVRLTRVGGPSEGWPSVPRHGGRGELQGQATEDDVGEVNRSDMEDEEDERTHAAEQQPRDEEYSEWGIDIYVAFRAGDSLQKLTNNRQSGGERAVSTALYLQALQFLTTAPFRVVDEINQGMDQSNERRVYNRIIETVCAGHGVGRPAGDRATQGHCPSTPAYSEGDEEVKLPGDGAGYRSETSRPAQYFLITPKLLPNLRYHERMKVLCIYNGEWIPEKLNLHKYLQKAGPK
ncbi:Structural maintenance of chromosomes protein 5, partial [Spiromyces aspiralis]